MKNHTQGGILKHNKKYVELTGVKFKTLKSMMAFGSDSTRQKFRMIKARRGLTNTQTLDFIINEVYEQQFKEKYEDKQRGREYQSYSYRDEED